ncbi:MAG: hypothetical protein Q9168_006360 [Polycauliona sp. 1 TL-2023]
MSAPSRDQYSQVSNSAASNSFNPSDTTYGNTLMSPAFPTFPQPNFGQLSQTWSNTPLPGYNFNLPFQSDFVNNNGFFHNQQNDLPDYDGNDDFYDNEMNTTDNLSTTLPANSKHSSGSLSSQSKVASAIRSPLELSKGPMVDPNHRAAELRARLLANKRPGSATPSAPRSAQKEMNDVKVHTDSNDHDGKGNYAGKTTVMPEESSSSQSVDKSSKNPSKAQSLPTHNADIEGLINEYRASEADRDSNLAVVGTVASDPTTGKAGGVTNNSRVDGRVNIPPPSAESIPKATDSQIPGSPESGEINSDQEPAINNDQNRPTMEKVNNQPRKVAEKQINPLKPDQRQPPKTPQPRAGDLNQATMPLKSQPGSLSQPLQNKDQRKSVNPGAEPRNIPLAQRITHVREEELRSPSLRETRNGNVQGRDVVDKVENSERQIEAKPSSLTAQSRPRLPSKPTATSRPDRHEQARKQSEELAAEYKRQLADHNTPSLRSNHAFNPTGTSRHVEKAVLQDKPGVNGTPADDSIAEPVKQQAPTVIPQVISSSDHQDHHLTHDQSEQIQKMGIDLSPQGLRDLYDFLEYHRYYVPEYREGFIARQKKFKALEAERLALERESILQFDHFTSRRSQSVAAREQTEPPTPVSVHRTISTETSAVKPMPPPLTLPKRASNGGSGELPGSADSLQSATRTNGQITPRESTQNSPLNPKRRRLEDEMELDQNKKVARVDTDLRSNVRGQDISPRTTAHDHPFHDRRYSMDQRPTGYQFRGRSRSPVDRRRSLSPRRRGSDTGYPPRQNSLAFGREKENYDGREQDYRRPSVDERRRDSAGQYTTNHLEERKPSYTSHAAPSFPSRGFRGGPRGGRSNFHTYRPRGGYSSHADSPAPSDWKNSGFVEPKAGGQSRSESSGLDLP